MLLIHRFMRRLPAAILIMIWCSPAILAQRTVKVTGQYTYHAPDNVTLEQAKATALDRAKIQAIADEFGTVVSQTNATRITNSDSGSSSVDFLSVGGSEVKGEWIETISQPRFDISYQDGMLIVSCSVSGKIRELSTDRVEFSARILRNGTTDRFESSDFRSGDDLYLSFTSPVSGYIAVYLTDDSGQAYCLLPYRAQPGEAYRVEANSRYLLFPTAEAPEAERHIVDEYVMTASRTTEHNMIHIIFSPNPFTKAVDARADHALPRELPTADFQKWMARARTRDPRMTTTQIPITISKH